MNIFIKRIIRHHLIYTKELFCFSKIIMHQNTFLIKYSPILQHLTGFYFPIFTEIMNYSPPPKEIMSYSPPPTEIMNYSPPPTEIMNYSFSSSYRNYELLPFLLQKSWITPFPPPPPTEIMSYSPPPTEIMNYSFSYRNYELLPFLLQKS